VRIVHTEASLGWGGQEIRILSESQGLIARGHEVRLLCPAEARIFAEAPRWRVPVSALPIGRKRPLGVKVLYEWLKRNRCDLVCTHSSTDSWLAAFALLALGRPVPMVRMRHISAPVPTNAPTRWLYTRASARIVTTGDALRKELIERNRFPEARIDSVPTGVDARRYRPGERAAARAALKLPHHAPLVGIVATLRDWKGHEYLIDALPENAHLVIVGDGPRREILENYVDSRGVRGRTVFAGDQADVVPWLQALDIFVLPSFANEGVPQALIQAMMTGLPCITTHAGSIAELALDGETALVVPTRNADAIRSALERLLRDEPLRKKLGEAARKHAAANFSLERMLDRMETIYRQVRR
jgi:glycosyltransferase involved in cell wall biosynthesis